MRSLLLSRPVLVLLGLLTSLVVSEVGLRGIERMRRRDAIDRDLLVEDPLLGRRLAPYAAGHDAKGFRNAAVPLSARLVALGDSQTWGVNAPREEAWPQQLATRSGWSVYNMSCGGFGAVHYLVLCREALAFSPRVIVVALYFGNDLYDAYRLVYFREAHAAMRSPDALPGLLRDTVAPTADALWKEHVDFQQRYARGDPRRLGLWLRGHTALGRGLERAGLWPGADDAWFEIGKAWAATHPDHGTTYERGRVRTVLTTAYRLAALDLSEPRVKEGLRLTKESLAGIRQRAEDGGARVLIVLLPTKERVHSVLAREGGADYGETHARLVANEDRARAEVLATCAAEHIECLDLLPTLRAAVEEGRPMYPTTTESHPSPAGYAAIAKGVMERLRELAW